MLVPLLVSGHTLVLHRLTESDLAVARQVEGAIIEDVSQMENSFYEMDVR